MPRPNRRSVVDQGIARVRQHQVVKQSPAVMQFMLLNLDAHLEQRCLEIARQIIQNGFHKTKRLVQVALR